VTDSHQPVRVGVVGLGAMGRRHAEAALGVAGIELVGVADSSTTPHAPIGDVRVVGSLTDLLELGVDACVVATPSPDHLSAALALAAAGAHALIEKPLAMDLEECEQIEAAFGSTPLVARVGHVERFNGALLALRARLRGGELGDLREIVTRREAGAPRRSDGGDVLLDLGTHDFDLVAWLTGTPFEPLSLTATRVGSAPSDQALRVDATVEGGLTTTHTVSWQAQERVRQVTVRGTAGALVADSLAQELRSSPHGAPVPVLRHDALTLQLETWRDLILGRLDGDDGLAGASLADGARAVAIARSVMARLRSPGDC
jgi:UDP-N-acetylglucosamine 3-dehydrogenase